MLPADLKSARDRSILGGMKRIVCALPLAIALAAPAAAQPEESEAPSLMQRGVEMFMEGLRQEMGPALEDLGGMAEDVGPAMGQFLREMGPALADVLGRIDDLSNYHLPEMLPNGDIVIRRKTPLEPDAKPEPDPQTGPEPEGQIEI